MGERENFDLTTPAKRKDLLDYVGGVEPRVALLSHGADHSRQWFADRMTFSIGVGNIEHREPGRRVGRGRKIRDVNDCRWRRVPEMLENGLFGG